MFLRTIEQHNLLSDKETHILRDFDDKTASALISTLTGFLELNKNQPNLLYTKKHVEWVMQCVGHSFMLSMDSHDDIIQVINLYNQWLFSERDRPSPIRDDETRFFKQMFCHFSMLFQDRGYPPGQYFDKHALLCEKVLGILYEVGRKLASRLDESSWDVLIKVILAICDELLQGSGNGHSLGNYLERPLFRLLLDLFVRSKTSDAQHWRLFSAFCKKWLHRKQFINVWSATLDAISLRLIRVLYGHPHGHDAVFITWPNGTKIAIKVKNPHTVIYIWHQVLRVVDMKSISNPYVLQTAIEAICRVAKLFIHVGIGASSDKPKSARPDGNSILDAVGDWLFENALIDKSGFEKARAASLGALCRIFCQKYGTDFKPEYTSLFFRCLSETLKDFSPTSQSVSAIIRHGATLLSTPLNGVRCLIPLFMQHLRYILTDGGAHSSLRRAAITMLGSLVSLNKHFFGYLETSVSQDQKIPSQMAKMRHHLVSLPHLLISSLETEIDVQNQEMILWTISVYIKIDASCASRSSKVQFPQIVISTLLSQIAKKETWSPPVITTAIDVLSSVAEHHRAVHQASSHTIPDFIKQMCVYIKENINHVTSAKDKQKETRQRSCVLALRGISCILHWLYCAPWIISIKAVSESVHECLIAGLRCADGTESNTYAESSHKYEAQIHSRCRTLLGYLLNNLGRAPSLTPLMHDPTHLYSDLSEWDLAIHLSQYDEKVALKYTNNKKIRSTSPKQTKPRGIAPVNNKTMPSTRSVSTLPPRKHVPQQPSRCLTLPPPMSNSNTLQPGDHKVSVFTNTAHGSDAFPVSTTKLRVIQKTGLDPFSPEYTNEQPKKVEHERKSSVPPPPEHEAPPPPHSAPDPPFYDPLLNQDADSDSEEPISFSLDVQKNIPNSQHSTRPTALAIDPDPFDADVTGPTLSSPINAPSNVTKIIISDVSPELSPTQSPKVTPQVVSSPKTGAKHVRIQKSISTDKPLPPRFRHFLFNDTSIITLAQLPQDLGAGTVIFMRDEAGKYSWKANFSCSDDNEKEIVVPEDPWYSKNKPPDAEQSITKKSFDKLSLALKDSEKFFDDQREKEAAERAESKSQDQKPLHYRAYSSFHTTEKWRARNGDVSLYSICTIIKNAKSGGPVAFGESNDSDASSDLSRVSSEQEHQSPDIHQFTHSGTTNNKLLNGVVEHDGDTKHNTEDDTNKAPPFRIDNTPAVKPPLPLSEDSICDFYDCRRLLANIGLITPSQSQPANLRILKQGTELSQVLVNLDRVSSRKQFCVSVLYRHPQQETEEMMLSNRTASEKFNKFVDALGCRTDLKTHRGYMGNLSRQDAEYLPYHATPELEMMFHVPTLMSECSVDRTLELHMKNYVRVIWSDEISDFDLQPQLDKREGSKLSFIREVANSPPVSTDLGKPKRYLRRETPPVVYIIVWPLGNGLYRIGIDSRRLLPYLARHRKLRSSKQQQQRTPYQTLEVLTVDSSNFPQRDDYSRSGVLRSIYRGNSKSAAAGNFPRHQTLPSASGDKDYTPSLMFGPLLQHMVVCESLVAPLVRETAINACMRVNEVLPGRQAQGKRKRQEVIKMISAEYALNYLQGTHFYSSLFTNSSLSDIRQVFHDKS